jgi:predicted lipoprotein with Yx(FWY)xxD motif
MSQALPRRIPILAVLLAATIVVAACGSGYNSTTAASSTSSAAGGSATAVGLDNNADLGEILVDADGRTLYRFLKDDSADESYCNSACAKAWPPLTTKDAPQAADGVDAGMLTTFKREDGRTQVAYAGHPLYLYAGDSAPGDANGNGLNQYGAEWYALDSSGSDVEGGSGSSSGSSSSGGYY